MRDIYTVNYHQLLKFAVCKQDLTSCSTQAEGIDKKCSSLH